MAAATAKQTFFGFVNKVLVVFAGNWLVGRHCRHRSAGRVSHLNGRTGHTTRLLIRAEEILEGDSHASSLAEQAPSFFRSPW